MSGFGRKGLEQFAGQGAAPPSRPAQSGLDGLRNTARGSLQSASHGADTSRKVEAFLTGERQRRMQEGAAGLSDIAASHRNADRPQRSLTMAYLLWFVLGQVSAHRFYLGAYRSAFAQLGLFAFWIVLALGAPEGSYGVLGPILGLTVIGWALWILGDVFFIHRIHRELCRKPGETAAVFA